jgi:hypothetical protein
MGHAGSVPFLGVRHTLVAQEMFMDLTRRIRALPPIRENSEGVSCFPLLTALSS